MMTYFEINLSIEKFHVSQIHILKIWKKKLEMKSKYVSHSVMIVIINPKIELKQNCDLFAKMIFFE